jgi:hypothetical protein
MTLIGYLPTFNVARQNLDARMSRDRHAESQITMRCTGAAKLSGLKSRIVRRGPVNADVPVVDAEKLQTSAWSPQNAGLIARSKTPQCVCCSLNG